ncbi:MAG: ribose 1,5-bisphosphate isomerase [Methanomicrobiaceae archaeon]|nr:ribose 1,5-bisphosphate isomerase [Methanomicrobiaceae archaeon]
MSLYETAEKIRTMEIRGAGKIARAAVEALKDHDHTVAASSLEGYLQEMERAAATLLATRPTAVSLPNALHFVMHSVQGAASLNEARRALHSQADAFIASSTTAVQRIGEIGARHISDGDVLMTHCNSQAALACILEAHRQGKEVEVFATEVRPRNQGLLTIRALNDAGIPTHYIVDSAARSWMNDIDLVIVGSDAIAVNGAVVNKIGTSQIALAAHEARTNLVVAAETYKFAPRTILGELIEIEERDPGEVLAADIAGTLRHVTVHNPAFDVTPAEYVDLIVTEQGAFPPELAYVIIREYLGWDIGEFHKIFEIHHQDQE